MSEKNHYLSPYNFADANPVFFNDPSGLDSGMPSWMQEIWNKSGSGVTTWTNIGGAFESNNGDIVQYLSIDAGGSGGGASGGSGGGFTDGIVIALNEVIVNSIPGGALRDLSDIGINGNNSSALDIAGQINGTLENGSSGSWSDFWNSPFARMLVPDKISFTLSTSVTAFVGVSEELSFNWITRGHDGSFVPYVLATTGVQAGVGVSGDALMGVSIGYFNTLDMRSIKKGDASGGLLGWSAYGSVDVGLGAGLSATGSVGFKEYPFVSSPTWFTFGIAGGTSIGAAGTLGVSYAYPVFPSQF